MLREMAISVRLVRSMPLTRSSALTLVGSLLATVALAGCSGRDIELSEKLAAIEAAAIRAEKAAERAEKAAKAAETHQIAEVVEPEAEPEPEQTDEDAAGQDPNPTPPQNGA